MIKAIRIELKSRNNTTLERSIRDRTTQIFNEAADEAVEALRRDSPVGATLELRERWRVIPARRSTVGFDTTVVIQNTADRAYNRLFGRPPGTPPPIAPLERWVEAKRPEVTDSRKLARAIAIKIGKLGTERYRENQPVLGINRDLTYQYDSPVAEAQRRINFELKRLKLK